MADPTNARALARDHAIKAAELLDLSQRSAYSQVQASCATQAAAHATLALFYQREAESGPRYDPPRLPDDPRHGLPTERAS